MIRSSFLAGLYLLLLVASPAIAADAEQAPIVYHTLHYASGEIALGEIATIALPEGFVALTDNKEINHVLEEDWGNFPEPDATWLALVFPPAGPDDTPEAAEDPTLRAYGVLMSYDKMGYVLDKDAGDIDYAELLRNMQKHSEEMNEAYDEAGYRRSEITGWAVEPRYDNERKILEWAKSIRFYWPDKPNEASETLNYDALALGRYGSINLMGIAGPSDLDALRVAMPKLAAATTFHEGYRYQDFNPVTDEVSATTFAALAAGGALAQKAGLFALLAKNTKLVFVAIFAGIAYVWERLRKKTLPADTREP